MHRQNKRTYTQALTNTENTDYEVKDSAIHLKGLFTKRALPAEHVLFNLEGFNVSHDYDPALSDKNPNWIGIGYASWIQLRDGDLSTYLNHSCTPNLIINDQLQLVTIEPVEAGKELLLDYSTTELDPFWKLDCNCGSPECRKTIRSYQYLPYDLKMKYNQYIAPVFNVVGEELILED